MNQPKKFEFCSVSESSVIRFFHCFCTTNSKKFDILTLCGSRKYPYSPHRRDWKFRGGGGVLNSQKFKAMYEAKLEFPEGWGVIRQIPSVGGYGYFLEPHIEVIKF